MIGIILGIFGAFGSLIIGAALFLGLLHGWIWLIILTALSFVVSMFLIVWTFLTGGVSDVFAGARLSGSPIGIVLRNDKSLKFVNFSMEQGLAKNRNYGRCLIVPDSVYNMPNGTVGFLMYYKYGVSLHPRFIRATSRMKEAGIEDIEKVEELNENARKIGKELKIGLDYVPKEEG